MTRRRLLRLVAATASVVLPVGGLAVGYQLTGLLSRPVQRQLTELVLRLVLVGYAAAVVLIPLGTIGLVVLLTRERRRRRRHPRLARLALLGVSGLFGLLMLEGMSALWEVWKDRLPALPERFAESSPPGTLHIVVVGGSSALGEPFRPWLSVGQVVARRLQLALPDRRVELTNLARLGACLKDMHEELAKLRRRPDVLIVYAGHNEFVARYEEGRDAGVSEHPAGRLLDAIDSASLRSPFCRLTAAVVSRNRLDGEPPRLSRHRLIDPPQVSPREYAAVRADFARRLEAIIAYCERIGCRPMLVIPPSNEGGLEPSRSVLPPSVGRAERERLTREMREASRASEGGPGRSALQYRAVLDRHPGFAEAHFRLARLLERRGEFAEANRHYVAARDHDGLPIRAPSDFQAAYREAAGRHPSAILIDGPAVLRAVSERGIVDDQLIQDAHHPTLLGTVALADAILHALHDLHFSGWGGPPPGPLDPATVAAEFGLDAARWVEVCNRTRVHYERIARYRFDPSERLARAGAYARAMRLVGEGVPPERAGVVGLGASSLP